MGKKMSPNQRAQAALRREAHMRTVYERQGDPRYVQRQRIDDQTVAVSMTPEVQEAVQGQIKAFKAKFGRDPLPDEPLFFDPEADSPQPLSAKGLAQVQQDMLNAAVEAGIDPAFIQASIDVGYLVTSMNEHTFTALEVEAYWEAVEHHRERNAR